MFATSYQNGISETVSKVVEEIKTKSRPELDKKLYDQKMKALANNPPPPVLATTTSSSSPTSSISTTVPATTTLPHYIWPTEAPYPLTGALLPFNRIVAYYGNFYSKGMGVLGEYEPEIMLQKFRAEVAKWEAADPETPVIPAIHYIAVTAQGSPGEEGLYRLRMPDSQIEIALKLAEQVNGIVFIDIQTGQSTIQKELPQFEKYLKLPNVHLALDPEFNMKDGKLPGIYMGTMDATEINYAADYIAKLVQEHDLPPKILVIHRFTQKMVTNYQNIKPLPEVQIVMDMDGWGPGPNKFNTYRQFIYPEPVQFTGFKLFYKNDLKAPSTGLLTPEEILKLRPRPIYIQYQ